MIHAAGLRKEFNGFIALDGISFDLPAAQILGVIGHNGAGKTTLLKIISGLITPTAGELTVEGIDVLRDPLTLKKMLGYLAEESRLYETMSVPAYLSFFGEVYGLSKGQIQKRADDLLGSLSLETDRKKIGELSKGMKKKVAIARSLLHDPRILIYDEPTSGLDPMTSRTIVEYLKELRKQGKTILLSAHNLYQVEEICDRVMILRRGKEVACGSMNELQDLFGSITYTILFTVDTPEKIAGQIPFTSNNGFYISSAASITEMNRITAAIAEAGGAVERIESRYPSLEEMLIKIGK
ncbi:MAG: ABC transporter ATP-binding protein [Methanomicrobiales archaeon]|nr:ABC transporter ATP-binding protein [Methanomicrobiales archaeon]